MPKSFHWSSLLDREHWMTFQLSQGFLFLFFYCHTNTKIRKFMILLIGHMHAHTHTHTLNKTNSTCTFHFRNFNPITMSGCQLVQSCTCNEYVQTYSPTTYTSCESLRTYDSLSESHPTVVKKTSTNHHKLVLD